MGETSTDATGDGADIDVDEAEDWVHSHVPAAGALRLTQREPWGSVYRARAADTAIWFKACATRQASEVPLTATLADRWPDVVTEVLAHDIDSPVAPDG